jgi:hypothetical protein
MQNPESVTVEGLMRMPRRKKYRSGCATLLHSTTITEPRVPRHLRKVLESGPLDELGGESAAHIIVRVLAKDVNQVGLPAVAGAEGVPHLLEADGLRLVVLVVVQVCTGP